MGVRIVNFNTVINMKFLRSLERLVYPDRCIICGDVTLEKAPFCKDCIKEFVSLFSAECPSCGKTAHECACGGGKKDFLFFYSSPAAKKLIRTLKHSPNKNAAAFFGDVIAAFYEGRRFDAVAFPPRTAQNVRKYGLDHVKAIAQCYSKASGVPLCPALERTHRAAEQKLLSAAQRRRNALGLYTANKEKLGPASRVLLIDDVRTTGSTMNACALALRKAGVKQITQFTLAYTPPASKKYKIKKNPAQKA